jgi:hypothetical protein
MGRTACTESQCLYKGDLYLTLFTLNSTHMSFLYNLTKYSTWWLNDVTLPCQMNNTNRLHANFTTTAITLTLPPHASSSFVNFIILIAHIINFWSTDLQWPYPGSPQDAPTLNHPSFMNFKWLWPSILHWMVSDAKYTSFSQSQT